jgi:nitrogen fixation NifU-like protein
MTRSRRSDVERMAEEIQQAIIQEEQALYSERVIQEAHHPRNVGRMGYPDVVGIVHGSCGDTMELYVKVDGHRIVEASFMTDGCGPAVACGSQLTSMIQGMSLTRAGDLTTEDLLSALDGLPDESLHCAELAVATLQKALASRQSQPPGDGDDC